MFVKVQFDSIPDDIKLLLINDIKLKVENLYGNTPTTNTITKFWDINNNEVEITNPVDIYYLTLEENEIYLQKIQDIIKEILINRAIGDHIVVIDPSEKEKLVIIKRSHGEYLGLYQCRHCGMEFDDEVQLSNHFRIHFFI
jgi:hypothetical protein